MQEPDAPPTSAINMSKSYWLFNNNYLGSLKEEQEIEQQEIEPATQATEQDIQKSKAKKRSKKNPAQKKRLTKAETKA